MTDRIRVLFVPTVAKGLLLLITSGFAASAFGAEPTTGPLMGTTAAHSLIRQNLNNGIAPVVGANPQPAACPSLTDFTWDDALAASAQAWANTCTDDNNNGIFDHDPDPNRDFGENLAQGTSGFGFANGPVATVAWAGEADAYDYANNQSNGVTGHYTQIAWASSTLLGCGFNTCPVAGGNDDWIVCRYKAVGNVNTATTRPYCTATQTTGCETGPGVCGGGGNQLLTVAKNGTGTGTVTSNPAGINCGGTCAFNFPDTTQVQLTAAAAGGSNFVSWGGDCLFAGANPTCTVTMNAAKNVTATFNIGGGGNACAGAIDLVCGVPFDGTTVGATADFDGYNCAGGGQAGTDIAFKLIPPQGGNVTVDLLPNVRDLDLFVINGCDTNNCSGGSENFTPDNAAEQVIFAAVGGQTYDVIVEDFTSAGDTFTLTATCPGGGCTAPDGQNQHLENTTENVDKTVHVCGTITTGTAYVIGGGAHVTLIAPTSVRFGNGFSVLANGRLTVRHN